MTQMVAEVGGRAITREVLQAELERLATKEFLRTELEKYATREVLRAELAELRAELAQLEGRIGRRINASVGVAFTALALLITIYEFIG